jgi:Lamin Tail Domain/CHU_C Type IX secretion signal domain/Bacterial Ig-like domain
MFLPMQFLKRFSLALSLFFCSFANAQVSDAFSDGDFTNNPTWSGDAADYIVNAGFQLQLNGTIADTSYLSFPSPFINNAEWQFWIRLNFAPSDNNNARIYIVSDVNNITGAVNGYYVRLGENGSFDSVDLWEQSGNTHTRIIDGVNAHCAASNNVLRIKLTRDATGNWNLLSDTLGGTNFQPEGSVFDNTHTTCNYFGVFSKYTVSNITKFYYDDVYAGPIIVDVTAPSLVSATATSATTLDVLFNEPVDLTSSQIAANYSVNNSIGIPTSAVRDGTNSALVHLTFSTSFVSAQNYTLTVTNVQDLNANAISTANTNFVWLPIGTALFHDVLINEIMADPSPVVGLPNTEFVELYNRSSSNFDLNGWTLTDGSSTASIGNYILPAGGYLIICSNADTALFTPFGPRIGVASFPSLNNAGDNLLLSDGASNPIDSLFFDISWYQDAVKDDGGWTLELINPNAGVGCALAGNWIVSLNALGGSPGTQNSVFNNSPDVVGPIVQSAYAIDSLHVEICFNEGIDPTQLTNLNNYDFLPFIGVPTALSYDTMTLACVTLTLPLTLTNNNTYTAVFNGLTDCAGNAANPSNLNFSYHLVEAYDVVINEIMADPDPPIALPNEEYAEIHNRTPYPIRLNNWTITVGTTTRVLPNVILPADSFAILTNTTAASFYVGLNAIGVTSFPGLTNTGSTASIRTGSGLLMHSISYDDSWYQDASKADGGWSLEMIDPNNPCAGSNNWKASLAPSGGTPGYQNSALASNPDNTAPTVIRVSVITADSIRVFFSEPLDSAAMSNVLRYFIDNGVGNPTSILPVAPDFTRCDLKLPFAISPNIIYTITVNNLLADCVGNTMGNPNTAPFALPQPAAANDLVINEILFDPNTGGTDFVEIYNRSNKVIDLKTILLCSQDTITNTLTELNVIAPEGYLLFPGNYLLLSEGIAAVQQQYPTQTDLSHCLEMTNIPSMNIDGDVLVLADTGFHIIDKLIYSSAWHFPLLQTTKGVSLERIDFERNTQDYTNWHSASETIGFATPTQPNSQYNPGLPDDGAVSVSNEIFSPDGDGYNDIVNINYNFAQSGYVANITIYDSRGRLVRTLITSELLGTETGTFSWDGTMDDRTKARVGAYIIYFEAFNANGDVKKYKRACVLAEKF